MDETKVSSIHGMISEICQHLTTSTSSKKHGGYQNYEDEKIRLSYDTYYPNVSVYVKTGNGEKVCVFFGSGGGSISQYSPGKWEEYLSTLYPKAVSEKERKQKIQEEERTKKRQATFGHVPNSIDEIFEKSAP